MGLNRPPGAIVVAGPNILDAEYLAVSGKGATRDAALSDANSQARAWFGDHAHLTRTVGRASAEVRLLDGTVIIWSVDCEYRPRLDTSGDGADRAR
jgi:hypothetical protein